VTYEYKIAVAYSEEGERDVLAAMGADGWLLCAVDRQGPCIRLYFSRVVGGAGNP